MPEFEDAESIETNGDEGEYVSEDEGLDPEELEKGYLRQADYTRKTQELAQLRKEAEIGLRLHQALLADPKGTIAALAAQTGVIGGPAEDDDDLHPLEVEIRKQAQATDSVQRELRALKLEKQITRAVLDADLSFEKGVDPVDAVMEYMLANDIGNPATAARFMALEAEGQERTASRQRVTESKRNGPPVHSGASRPSKTAVARPKDIYEAAALASKGIRIS